MSLPSPFKVLTEDQSLFEYTGAVAVTWKPTELYDGSTYRNLFPNQYVVPPVASQTLALGAGDTAVNVTTLQEPGAVTPITNTYTDGAASNTATALVVVDDSVAAVEPRPWLKIRTLVEFWDDTAVGQAMTLTATLTSGSATIAVSDNRLLTPGQAISGTGIPTGARILRISPTVQTVVVLSHKATATGDQEATLTGSNRVGYYYADEGLGGAEGVSLLM